MVGQNLFASTEICSYCKGDGYVQLLLGGSETCGCCKGTGKKPVKDV
ncbi:MAG: YuiA family protein [Firmicutes bacterium]|uniref:Uncharacterized protein n=1 Tax=Melghirimyces thermohalophilus TaxID=1236220 RepID=A0A1G6L6K8_9BACL|nr:YuiA family protein [Melghirimyces thermohalophilus]MDA8353736.1 YuiA family protein [Bacillota bacterium]SDC38962.1 hypothetical protein SAMN04488112_10778 [Melghirimyces thermohalophilus]